MGRSHKLINQELRREEILKLGNLQSPRILQKTLHFASLVRKKGQHRRHHPFQVITQCCTTTAGFPQQLIRYGLIYQDHVAVVLRNKKNELFLYESSSFEGVGFTEWKHMIKYEWYKSTEKYFLN